MTLRSQVVCAGAVAALGLVAVGAVLLATGPDLPPASAPSPSVESPVTASEIAERIAAAQAPPAPASPASAPEVEAAPASPSPAGATEPRLLQLPPRATAELASSAARCLREGGAGGSAPTVLALRLRALADGVEVTGADVASSGDADPSIVACAREAVRGTRLAVAGFAPGELLEASWTVSTASARPGGVPAAAAPGTPRVFRRQRGK
jgi:hypothetical protein